MKNEEIKKILAERLAKWTKNKSETSSIIVCPGDEDNTEIKIRSDYNSEEFGFPSEKLVEKRNTCCSTGCSAGKGICVGVGKGCPKNPENEELWFLWEDRDVISHFCGARAESFSQIGIIAIE